MGNSLGDYKIEKSSSADISNIKWTQKNPDDFNKTKNKKKTARKTSASNIIYTQKPKKIKLPVEKIFKIEAIMDNEKFKNKNKKAEKKFQTSSASYSLIHQGFTRPAR